MRVSLVPRPSRNAERGSGNETTRAHAVDHGDPKGTQRQCSYVQLGETMHVSV